MDIKEIALKEVGEPVAYQERQQTNDGFTEWYDAYAGADICGQGSKVCGGIEYQWRGLYTPDQVAAAVLKATKPLEKEIERLQDEDNLPVRYYQPNGKGTVYAVYGSSSIDFVEKLRNKLAAAQEEIQKLRQDLLTSYGESEELSGHLAKAEQRVAEACALQVATETKFHWLDAARVAKEIRSGEWRKFVKEV